MGTIFVQTTGALTNSGTSDNDLPDITLTVDASYTGSGTTIPVVVNSGSLTTSVVTTPGPTQSAVNFAGATNANRTIFWITAFNDSSTPKTITVDAAPTGLTAGSTLGKIGGRYVWPGGSTANVIEGALGLSTAQDVVQFNDTPAVRTLQYLTFRNAGSTTNGGFVCIQGKAGSKPVLQVTGAYVINQNILASLKIANLELKNITSGGIVQNTAADLWLDNVKISAASGQGLQSNNPFKLTNSEVTGCASDGVGCGAAAAIMQGNYIHGNTGAGINANSTGPSICIVDNLIVGNTGKGVYFSGATTQQNHLSLVNQNTIVDNGDSGIEVANANTVLSIRNNIIRTAAAGVSTIKWAAGNSELFTSHSYNVIWNSNSSSSGVTSYTLNSTEVAADPQFVNAGGGNYAIANASPAAGAGFPGVMPGLATTTGYQDIGTIQRQVVAGGGSGVIVG